VKHAQRRAVGAKVADLVIRAESEFPRRGAGIAKRNWVLREAQKTGPVGTGASADFGRWLGKYLLRVAIEVGVAVLNRTKNDLE